MFSYSITAYFIFINKYYNSCHNSHLVYQTWPKFLLILYMCIYIYIYIYTLDANTLYYVRK